MDKRLHYWNFSFYGTSVESPRHVGFMAIRLGWLGKFVNEARIASARESACGFDRGQTLISVSYLGHMTPTQMREGELAV